MEIVKNTRELRRAGGRYKSLMSRTEITQYQLLFEAGLWLLVSFAFVLDSFTTTIGIQHGFVETNPVLRTAFAAFGDSVIWLLKGIAISVALLCWALFPHDERVFVPVVFGLPWAFAVVSNLGLLLSL